MGILFRGDFRVVTKHYVLRHKVLTTVLSPRVNFDISHLPIVRTCEPLGLDDP